MEEREVKMRSALKAKLEYARFLQKTLYEMSPQDASSHHSKSASDFVEFYDKIKARPGHRHQQGNPQVQKAL